MNLECLSYLINYVLQWLLLLQAISLKRLCATFLYLLVYVAGLANRYKKVVRMLQAAAYVI
jgi:hypothetical protein